MEDNELFMKGVNHGYIMTKDAPQLYQIHLNSLIGDSPYKSGAEYGKQVFLDMKEKQNAKKRGKGRGMS